MTTLRISDILAHDVPVDWYEAIALVRDGGRHGGRRPGARPESRATRDRHSAGGRVFDFGGAVPRIPSIVSARCCRPHWSIRIHRFNCACSCRKQWLRPAFGSSRNFRRPSDTSSVRIGSGYPGVARPGDQYVATRRTSPAPTLDMIAPLPDADERRPRPKRSAGDTADSRLDSGRGDALRRVRRSPRMEWVDDRVRCTGGCDRGSCV